MTVTQRGTPAPDARVAPLPFQSNHQRAILTIVALGLPAALALASIGVWAHRLVVLHGFETGFASLADLDSSENVAAGLETGVALSYLLPGILWLMWQFHAHRNLRALGASGLRFTPGWSVAWWFIPFANLAMPYLTMRELWKASDSQGGAVDWQAKPTPPLLVLWWAAYLLRAALFVVGGSVAPGSNSSISRLRAEAGVFIASDVVLVAAAVLAALVVWNIDRRQHAKQARLTAWAGATGG